MKKWVFLLAALSGLAGCQSNNLIEQFDMGETVASSRNMAILDPEASVRDEGRINDLDGQYGAGVMDNYRKSTYAPKTARGSLSNFSVGGSRSSN
ncbi:hypothetical protein KUV89_00210 [Marinobacter hydrocarbonoclasticus]|nr:hypothetical protein [Marinobacter nauticus]